MKKLKQKMKTFVSNQSNIHIKIKAIRWHLCVIF